MSFEYDVESAVREAIRRGSHSDYSYRKLSRRQASIGVPGPRLVDAGAVLAIVVELSSAAAQEYVDEAQDALGRALRQHPVRSLAVIGPEAWEEWANEHWESRPFGTLEAEHIEAARGEALLHVNDLEKEPTAVVRIADENPIWPEDLDPTNLVLIVIPRRLEDGRITVFDGDPPAGIAEYLGVATPDEGPPTDPRKS